MDEKTLLALFDKFEKSTAVEMKFSGDGNTLELRRKEAFATVSVQSAPTVSALPVTVSAHEPPHTASVAPHAPAESSGSGEFIKSPIVGTFYRSASPDAPPFSEIGKTIGKGQKLCIIEAMKMMNALEAEFDCVIEKILVANGDMVEFDQPLFEVRKV